MDSGIHQQREQLQILEEGARPAVGQPERERFPADAGRHQRVHDDAFELDLQVTVAVEAVLEGLGIEGTPFCDQIGKPSPRYASLQVCAAASAMRALRNRDARSRSERGSSWTRAGA